MTGVLLLLLSACQNIIGIGERDPMSEDAGLPTHCEGEAVARDVGAQATTNSCSSPPANGLRAHWTADGTFADQSNGVDVHDGTPHGSVSFTGGVHGQAFLFDGESYVEASTTGFPIDGADRTLALWVRLDDLVVKEAFFAGYGVFGELSKSFFLGATKNPDFQNEVRMFFSQWGTGMSDTQPMSFCNWYHVTVVNQGGTQRFFVDGRHVQTARVPVATAVNGSFYMGSLPEREGYIRRLKGAVDEVLVYDRALADAEISSLAACRTSP